MMDINPHDLWTSDCFTNTHVRDTPYILVERLVIYAELMVCSITNITSLVYMHYFLYFVCVCSCKVPCIL